MLQDPQRKRPPAAVNRHDGAALLPQSALRERYATNRVSELGRLRVEGLRADARQQLRDFISNEIRPRAA